MPRCKPCPPPPPLGGQNVCGVPTIVQANMEPTILVPHLKGLGEPVTRVLNCKCSVFSQHFPWAPKRAGFVQPFLILWPHQSFPAMGTNGDKCRLLLIEDPALEAQPRHEVAVGVFGPSPPPPPPPTPPSRGQNGVSGSRTAPGHPYGPSNSPWLVAATKPADP